MGRGQLICLVGIDGSGKSTAANRLRGEHRGANGRAFDYLWFRSRAQLGVSSLLRRIRPKRRAGGALAGEGWRPKRSTLATRIYEAIVWADYYFLALWKVRFGLHRGRNFVCDRYAHDIAVDLAADHGWSQEKLERAFDRVDKAFPRPDRIFVFDVPSDVSLARKNDVPNREFLEARRRGYAILAKRARSIPVDGTRPRDDIHKDVVNMIENEEAVV